MNRPKRIPAVRGWLIAGAAILAFILWLNDALWLVVSRLLVIALVLFLGSVALLALGAWLRWGWAVRFLESDKSSPAAEPSRPAEGYQATGRTVSEPIRVIHHPTTWEPGTGPESHGKVHVTQPEPTERSTAGSQHQVQAVKPPRYETPLLVEAPFCPECKTLMRPNSVGILNCGKCGSGPYRRANPQVIATAPTNRRRAVVSAAGEDTKGIHGTTSFSCPKCGHDRAEAEPKHVRGPKHHPSWLLTCMGCGHRVIQDSK